MNLNKKAQIKKAEQLLQFHHDKKLLILPNIWDPLGACMVQSLGFPAVATASAAIAFSQGFDDGEQMLFSDMLRIISRIAQAVDVPVTADIERGYATELSGIIENVHQTIRAGIVGINIEDSTAEGGPLVPLEVQCERLRAIRKTADHEGIPLVINARTDVFLSGIGQTPEARLKESIVRGQAYRDAGADCFYPITLSDLSSLKKIISEVQLPVNVYGCPGIPTLKKLEEIGVNRVSTGPGLLKATLGHMRDIAKKLMAYGDYDALAKNAIQSDDILEMIGVK